MPDKGSGRRRWACLSPKKSVGTSGQADDHPCRVNCADVRITEKGPNPALCAIPPLDDIGPQPLTIACLQQP